MCILDVSGKNNKTGGICKMKKDKKIKKMALRVVERIIRNEAEKAMGGDDGPFCIGVTHQPKRPKRKED